MTVGSIEIASRSRIRTAWAVTTAAIAAVAASTAPGLSAAVASRTGSGAIAGGASSKAYGVLVTEIGQVAAYLFSLTAVVLALVACGLAVKRSIFGALLNGRNTYSLARLQMLLWTVLVVAALLAITVSRAWLGHEALAINIPDELLAAMGISFASAAATPAVMSLKTASSPSATEVEAAKLRFGDPVVPAGHLIARPSPSRASFRDLIQGDEVSTAGLVDISKVQQLLVTVLLVTIYGVMLGKLLAAGPLAAVPTPLPAFNTSFLTLMAISHGGYLAYTGVSKPASSVPLRPPPPDRNAGVA